MDEEYEAEFFKLLLNENNTTQFFLFSPTQNTYIEKILSDIKMKYGHLPNITIHIIISGPEIPLVDEPLIINLIDEK